MRSRTLRSVWFLASVLILALLAPIAEAGDVKVKVKRGDLIITGGRDVLTDVAIHPTATGLRVEVSEECTLNGGTEPFDTDAVTRDWKFQCARMKGIGIDAKPPGDGIPALNPRNVVFTGPPGVAQLSLEGVNVRGDVVVNERRSRISIGASLTDCTVGGSFRVSMGNSRGSIWMENTTVLGKTRLGMRAATRGPGQFPLFTVRGCTLGPFRLDVALLDFSEVHLDQTTFSGNVLIRANHDLYAEDLAIDGKLTIRSNVGEQDLSFERTSVVGTTSIVTARSADRFSFIDCTLGTLDVRGGPGNDNLGFTRTTVGPESRYDGSRGSNDRFGTAGDPGDVALRGVEDVRIFDPTP